MTSGGPWPSCPCTPLWITLSRHSRRRCSISPRPQHTASHPPRKARKGRATSPADPGDALAHLRGLRGPSRVTRRTSRHTDRWCTPPQKSRPPPDLVVKLQPIDIVHALLWPVLRPRSL